MAHPDRDFLPGRRLVLAGVAAAIGLPATAWAEIPKSLATGAMERFKPARPPKPMPDLEFLDADDKPLRLANLTGKARLINLWATWCGPCVAELPQLDAIAASHPGLRVLTVNQDTQKLEAVAPFLKAHGVTHLEPWLNPDNSLTFQFGAETLPATVLYDSAGREVWRTVGGRDWASADTAALLAEAK